MTWLGAVADFAICRTVLRDCPSCGYKKSLSATIKDGRELFYCHVGCSQADLLAALRGKAEPFRTFTPSAPKGATTRIRDYALKLWQERQSGRDGLVPVYLASRGLVGGLDPALLTMTPEAKALWITFHDGIESHLRSGGDFYDVRDVAAKTADNAARLAALFHVLDHGVSGASRFPFGRFKSQSDTSGEVFRDTILVPALQSHQQVDIILDGTQGYGSSFLEEAFGGLIREKGFDYDALNAQLKFISKTDPTLPAEINGYMMDAQKGKK